uniref:Leptin receptor gene-related protein-like n=1 Tax=Phallusia mammillata TaxID=59560 RepID=A0A6F9DIY6_9ASCI|nr:leptin receptor gene-related protein-like [Phallusia mammillata]
MAVKGLVLLALAGSAALTFLMLACVLPQFGVYWPLFVLMFYFLAPIPILIARKLGGDADSTSTACKELAVFFTTGIVVSAFGLPVILAHAQIILWGACAFVLAGNIIAFLTILGFFMYFTQDSDYEFQRW